MTPLLAGALLAAVITLAARGRLRLPAASRRTRAALAAAAALAALCFIRVPFPVAGSVPALYFVLLAELAALAVIAWGIARSLGWQVMPAWR